MKFYLFENKGIYIPELNINLLLGMTKSEVHSLIKEEEFFYGKTFLKYPKKVEKIEEDFEYERLGNLRLRFQNDELVFIIIKLNNQLLYKDINLTNFDFKSTFKMLKKENINLKKIDNAYYSNDLGVGFSFMDNKLSSVNVHNTIYYKNLHTQEYFMKMSRDKDDNVVIRFTERYKKNTFKI
jgi:hypothetical protein